MLPNRITKGSEHELGFSKEYHNLNIKPVTRIARQRELVRQTDDMIADLQNDLQNAGLGTVTLGKKGLYSNWKVMSDASLVIGDHRTAPPLFLNQYALANRIERAQWRYQDERDLPANHPENNLAPMAVWTRNAPLGISLELNDEAVQVETFQHGRFGGAKKPCHVRLEPFEVVTPAYDAFDERRADLGDGMVDPKAENTYGKELQIFFNTARKPPWRIEVDVHCSVHVHVGLPLQDHLQSAHCLPILRRITVVAMVCEQAMTNITGRNDPQDFAQSYRENHAAAANDPHFSLRELFNYIMACRSIRDLQKATQTLPWMDTDQEQQNKRWVHAPFHDDNNGDDIWEGNRYYRISLAPLENPLLKPGYALRHNVSVDRWSSGQKGTMEFRVHPGSTDEVRILMWSRLAAKIFEVCAGMSDKELLKTLTQRGGYNMTADDFLELFGSHTEAQPYYADHNNRLPFVKEGSVLFKLETKEKY